MHAWVERVVDDINFGSIQVITPQLLLKTYIMLFMHTLCHK